MSTEAPLQEQIAGLAENLLTKIRSSEILEHAFNQAGWSYDWIKVCGYLSDRTYHKPTGILIGVERWESLPQYAASMDFKGNFVWLWYETEHPDRVAVVSQNPPVIVDMTDDNWEYILGEAVVSANDNPGTYTDYELEGRESNYIPPVF